MNLPSKKVFSRLMLVSVAFAFASCASTGPKVSKAEIKKKEEEFNLKFFQASEQWQPRVYRVGYQLVKSPVPGHHAEKAKYNFVGVGVDELKDYGRKSFGIDKSIKGVLVRGVYPGSAAENVDVKPGDVITKIDGKKIGDLGDYFKAIRKTQKDQVTATLWRRNAETSERQFPVEKVYYNAQFFLAPTPQFDANALFSKIQVGIGALRYSHSDDELAVIMGHELAHVTLRHSAKKLGAGIGMGLAYGTVAGVIDAFTLPGVGSAIVNPALQASQAKLSRRYEREADYYGMQHAFHSGFDVNNGSRVFARLGSDAPGFEVLAYTFSSHPNTPERVLRLEKTIDEFKTKYPEKFPMKTHEDWQVIVPVNAGESLEEALQKMIASSQGTAAIQTATATMATPSGTSANVFEDFDLTVEKLRPVK